MLALSFWKKNLAKLVNNLLVLKRNNHENMQSGQALLIVLLLMSVVLTVALSSVSRSVTDVQISSQQEDSLRALNAAEAGIEKTLLPGAPGTLSLPSYDANTSTSIDVTTSTVSPLGVYEYPRKLRSGDTATFWFVSHDLTTGNFTCTGAGQGCLRANQLAFCVDRPQNNTCNAPGNTNPGCPAFEVEIYYDATNSLVTSQDASDINVHRLMFDTNSTRIPQNHFTALANSCPTMSGYTWGMNGPYIRLGNPGLNIPCLLNEGCLVMARVKMLYNTEPVKVGIWANYQAGKTLPAQGKTISSTGKSGDATRKVEVLQGYPELPSIFDASLFGGSIVKP
jgi:hypothetical protein